MLTSVKRGDFLIRYAGFLSVAAALALPAPGARAAGKRGAGSVGGGSTDAAERQATARALFQQGLNNLRAERWADAADRFERAMALKPTPEIAYNLSSALLHLGKLVRASEVLRLAAEDPHAAEAVRQAAAARLEQVLPRLGSLTVRIDGPADGVTVSLDGRPLDPAMLSVPVPVDPTRHVLVAVRGIEPIYDQTLDVKEGERAPLTIVVPASPAAGSALPAAPVGMLAPRDPAGADVASTAARPSPPRLVERWWFWTIVGGVAAGTVTAIVLATRSSPSVQHGSVDTVYYPPPR
jgi:hypothetical protein